MSRRSRKPLALTVAAIALTAAAVGAGVLIHRPQQPAPAPAPLAASLTSVDTTMLVVRRDPFCGDVSAADAAAALGGPVRSATAYAPGQQARLGSAEDVADEHGCQWTAAHGASAAAWVFAPPVTPAWARQVAADRPAGCRAIHAPAYGEPTSAYSCDGAITLSGLFGDAWLSCRLDTHDVALAGRWCLAVARAAN